MYPFNEVNNMSCLASILGGEIGVLPNTYLGMPLLWSLVKDLVTGCCNMNLKFSSYDLWCWFVKREPAIS